MDKGDKGNKIEKQDARPKLSLNKETLRRLKVRSGLRAGIAAMNTGTGAANPYGVPVAPIGVQSCGPAGGGGACSMSPLCGRYQF
jgi:hypothetical protein